MAISMADEKKYQANDATGKFGARMI